MQLMVLYLRVSMMNAFPFIKSTDQYRTTIFSRKLVQLLSYHFLMSHSEAISISIKVSRFIHNLLNIQVSLRPRQKTQSVEHYHKIFSHKPYNIFNLNWRFFQKRLLTLYPDGWQEKSHIFNFCDRKWNRFATVCTAQYIAEMIFSNESPSIWFHTDKSTLKSTEVGNISLLYFHR